MFHDYRIYYRVDVVAGIRCGCVYRETVKEKKRQRWNQTKLIKMTEEQMILFSVARVVLN